MTEITDARLRAALRRTKAMRTAATRWIVQRVGPDGRPIGAERLNGYYRLPWVLGVNGEREVASRVLSWIAREAIDEHGDLRPGPPRLPFERSSNASYPLSQLAIGAWHLEQYGLARRVMDGLVERFQSSVSGGVYSERPEHRGPNAPQDILVSAQFGMAALTTGDVEAADRVATWFTRLYEAQPDLPRALYCSATDDGLITTFDDATAWNTVVFFDRPYQAFYMPGIAAAFLGRHYQLTGQRGSLQLADAFVELSAGGAELQWDHRQNAQMCKFPWGTSVLLDAAPDPRYAAYTLRMVDWFEASQEDDGRWHPSSFLNPDPDDVDDMPKVAEHLLHLTTMEGALASYATARLG